MHTAQQEVERLLGALKTAAKDPSRFESLSDEMRVLTAAYMVPAPEANWHGIHLTKLETRLANCLSANFGKATGKEAMMNAMYFDKPSEPCAKIVDIKICHLRKKLTGSKFTIETVWGQGYRLTERKQEQKAA